MCVQCEIKLIRCDNETEIIYGYEVMLVCLFFVSLLLLLSVFHLFSLLILLFQVFSLSLDLSMHLDLHTRR